MKSVSYDVLVIGGGLAGLTAAVEAGKMGLNVAVISRSMVGKSGNTIIAGNNISIGIEGDHAGDSPQLFMDDVLASGQAVNDKSLVELFSTETFKMTSYVNEYGIDILGDEKGWVRRRAPGHTVPRTFSVLNKKFPYRVKGLSLTTQILKKAMEYNVKIFDNHTSLEILKTANNAVGVMVFNRRSGQVLQFMAKATIIACGGGGRLFARSNNLRDVTGDSFGLALEAGCQLRDMEFVQFYPTMCIWPGKFTVSNPLFGHGAFLENSLGERFMSKYDPRGDLGTRDVMARAIFAEVKEGRGVKGAVYINLTEIGEKVFDKYYPHIKAFFAAKGLDYQNTKLLVQPTTHFFCGGIAVNSKTETGIPGLFAAGEAVGGIHGCNRLSGNALADAIVFGRIAGKSSGQYAKNVETFKANNYSLEQETTTDSLKIKDVFHRIKTAMWDNVSLVRDENSLNRALQSIQECKSSLPKDTVTSVESIEDYFSAKHMVLTAEAIIKAALLRKESRGSHYRADAPTKQPGYEGRFTTSVLSDGVEVKLNQ